MKEWLHDEDIDITRNCEEPVKVLLVVKCRLVMHG